LHELLRELGDLGAAAVIVRAPVPTTPTTDRVARQAGVVLLSLTPGASWSRLAAMLRTLLNPTEPSSRHATIGGLPSGDLFSLANAIAALVDAPITIEDRSLNVLAFSGQQKDADDSRIETILGRQVPQRFADALARTGALEEVYASRAPVLLRPEQIGSEEIFIPRVAVAIRAGDEVLGSIWAVVQEPLDQERTAALSEAAKVASLHLLRVRAGADIERRIVADLIATAMDGGPTGPEVLSRLGLLRRTLVVVALGVLTSHDEPGNPSIAMASRQKVADALALHMSAIAPGSAVGQLGDVAYGLLPVTGAVDAAMDKVTSIAADFLTRTGSKLPAVIGIGPVATDPSQLGRSRMGADRALRVLTNRGRGGQVATISDVLGEALLLELGDIAAARGDVLAGPIAKLAAYDAQYNSELVHTLRCWLDCFGDVADAAAKAFVHPNTFRYRLRRLVEVSGIDLKDADARFAAMLQFRLPLQ
jgi:DNA-binding PucR family transcriptional regulator